MHPLVRWSAREPIADGTHVAPALRAMSGSASPTCSKLLILVHGYNNTAEDAAESYGRFLENTGLHRSGRAGQVCLLHWPGNKAWGFVSFASYPLEIARAQASAALLQGCLEELARVTPGGWPLEITLVCHSLGNRLGLELVERCRRTPHLVFPHACLMAAAVPTFRVEAGGSLHDAARAIARSLTLFSDRDPVLRWAFPLGQTVAGDGVFPTAVGRFGQPERGSWTERKPLAYGHGDYWSGSESAAEWLKFLGAPVAPLPVGVLPTAPLAPGRTLAARPLTRHDLAAPRSLPST